MAVDKDFSVKNGLKVATTISGGDTSITGFINVSSTANIGGAISACSTLTVAGNTTLNGGVQTGTGNVNFDSGTLFIDAVNNRIGIANTTPDAALTVTGSANVSGTLRVAGDLIVSGTTTSAGTQEVTGDIIPVSNAYSLGNTTNRWTVNGLTANFASNVAISGNLVVSGTKATLNSVVEVSDSKITISANATTSVNASFIVNRGSTGGNVSIRWNETSDVWQFTNDGSTFNNIGTSNTVGTVTSVTVAGNSVGGITGTGTITDSGTIYISAQAANTTANGTVKLLDSVTNTSINTYAPTANAVKLAFDTAISANTRAGSAQTAAVAAYSNAIVFAANATNLTTGTVSNARLNSGNTTAAGIVQLVEGVGNTSIVYAATANSVKTAYDNAATAYSNATSYADTKAATAYSNAVAAAATDASTKAATAYTNAIAVSATAYSNAIATSAADATSKAATAYSNATAYADTKAATAYTNAISYSGNAALAYANAIAFAANATNITSGTIANARLNAGNTTAPGIVQLVEGVTNNSVIYAATANSVKTAYDNATTAYTNAATYADTKAATAYSNAITFSANATNISSGTLANARLPSAISVTSVTTSGNVTSTAGAFTGNGAGLTSVSYISTSSSAVDTSIFVGGDKNTWKDGSVFYPTVASGVSTLAVGVSAGFFIKQVADLVTANNDVAFGPGNPQLLYRIVKVPSVGGNTVLYTSSNNILSTPGSGGGFLINAVDTTPSSGNSTGYAIQYLWQDVSADPNANAGTITTSNDTTVTVTGTGTYFTATINSRLQIAAANATTNTTPYVNVAVVFGNGDLDLEAKLGTKVTNSSYRVRDQYANVIMDQTDILFTFVGYK